MNNTGFTVSFGLHVGYVSAQEPIIHIKSILADVVYQDDIVMCHAPVVYRQSITTSKRTSFRFEGHDIHHV